MERKQVRRKPERKKDKVIWDRKELHKGSYTLYASWNFNEIDDSEMAEYLKRIGQQGFQQSDFEPDSPVITTNIQCPVEC